MRCMNEARENGKMPAKDAADERSTGANQARRYASAPLKHSRQFDE